MYSVRWTAEKGVRTWLQCNHIMRVWCRERGVLEEALGRVSQQRMHELTVRGESWNKPEGQDIGAERRADESLDEQRTGMEAGGRRVAAQPVDAGGSEQRAGEAPIRMAEEILQVA